MDDSSCAVIYIRVLSCKSGQGGAEGDILKKLAIEITKRKEMYGICNDRWQEPITWSVHLPY